MHPALFPGATALVTGGASGIGLAAARHLAGLGLRVCLVDQDTDGLVAAHEDLIAAGATPDGVQSFAVDLGDKAQVLRLADSVERGFGTPHVLLNNAGMQPGSTMFDDRGNWDRILDVNLMGIVRLTQTLAPRMIASGRPGLIVNTGSKQGITTPPGDPAYNLSKAGVKVFTEALQHHLRNLPGALVEARLFIPGFVFTPLTAHGRTERPAGAWTPEQTAAFLFESLDRDDFYILCPDNEVDRDTDAHRILWAADDIAQNRPPLSRWHKDHTETFKAWLAARLAEGKTG